MNNFTQEEQQKLALLMEKETNNICRKLLDELNENLKSVNLKPFSDEDLLNTREGFTAVFLAKQIAALSIESTMKTDSEFQARLIKEMGL